MTSMTQPTTVSRQSILQSLLAFKRTALLRTALELRLFDALADGARDCAAVTAAMDVPEHGVRVLLGALAAAGLLVEEQGRYALPPGAAELLVSASPDYAGGAARVAASYAEWDAMRDLTAVVRNGGTLLATDAGSPDFAYWQDFAAQGTFATRALANAVADALALWAVDRDSLTILDVGAGPAVAGLTLAKRHPQAHVTALDWPPVLEHARRNASAVGVSDRFDLLPGDAFTVEPGGPYDVILVANLLPQLSDVDSVRLLRRLAGRLAPNGRLVVAGFTVGDQPAAAEFGAHMLSLLMLCWTPAGRVRRTPEMLRLLAEAGLSQVTVSDVPGLPNRVFTARPPAKEGGR